LLSFDSGLAEAFDSACLDAQNLIDRDHHPAYTKQVFVKKPQKMIDEIAELINQETKNIKIKLGRNVNDDIYLIKKLKSEFPNINFKADVNRGYDRHSFIRVLEVSDRFIDLWEEPVKNVDQSYLPDIKRKYQIKIMLDESIRKIEDLKKYINEKIIDVLNVKLSRVGGISEAKKYLDICNKSNVGISIGCNEELGVGMWTINTLSKKINNLAGVEGIGPERLGFDIIENNQFSDSLLKKAGAKKHFDIFTENRTMTNSDIFNEIKENYAVKFMNLLILCKII
jgi:L-alanine-DL-glutamate epimerase-like enolase superfamily enzyme